MAGKILGRPGIPIKVPLGSETSRQGDANNGFGPIPWNYEHQYYFYSVKNCTKLDDCQVVALVLFWMHSLGVNSPSQKTSIDITFHLLRNTKMCMPHACALHTHVYATHKYVSPTYECHPTPQTCPRVMLAWPICNMHSMCYAHASCIAYIKLQASGASSAWWQPLSQLVGFAPASHPLRPRPDMPYRAWPSCFARWPHLCPSPGFILQPSSDPRRAANQHGSAM